MLKTRVPNARFPGALAHETKVFAQISSQVEHVRGISLVVIFVTDKQSFVQVQVQLSGSGKQTVVGSYCPVTIIGLYRFHGMLLLTAVQIQAYLVQV